MKAEDAECRPRGRWPLFAADAALRKMVAPHLSSGAWKASITLLEATEGFPSFDATMGGRYVPAVELFFEERQKRLADSLPPGAPPEGSGWHAKSRRKVPIR